MKKILQIFVFLIYLLSAEAAKGQYVNEFLLYNYLKERTNLENLDATVWGDIGASLISSDTHHYLFYADITTNSTYSFSSINYIKFGGSCDRSIDERPVKYVNSSPSTMIGITDVRNEENFYLDINIELSDYSFYRGPYSDCFRIPYIGINSFKDNVTNVETNIFSLPLHRPLRTEEKNGLFNTYLPFQEKIKIYGRWFPHDTYNFQYCLDGCQNSENWVDVNKEKITNFYLSSKRIGNEVEFNLSASDIFGSEEEAKKHIRKKVQIRVASLKYQGQYLSWSEPTPPLTITPSAPTLTQVTPTLDCSYDKGAMKIKFSRKPYEGERLWLYIENFNETDANFPIDNVGTDHDVTAALLSSPSTTPELTVRNVSEGTYKIQLKGIYTYTDTNGQTQSISTYTSGPEHTYTVKVEAPKPLEALQTNVLTTPTSCYGTSDGSLSFSGVSGGTPPYSYQISKPDKTIVFNWVNFTEPNSFSVQGIPQGRYHIRLRDSKGCVVKINNEEVQFTADVSGPSQALQLTAISGHPNHYDKKGDVTLQVSGGTPPYAYEIRTESSAGNVQETGTLTASGSHRVGIDKLFSGQYYAKITDAKGCISENFFSIKAPLGIVSSTHTDIKCYDDSTGTIAFEVRGGTPPYRYENPQDGKGKVPFAGNATTITTLKQGTYEILVFDSEGKQAVHNGTPIAITKTISAPQRAISIFPASGFASYENTLEVTITGGTPSSDGKYEVEWRTENNSGSVITSGITNQVRGSFLTRITNLSVGNYHLKIKDANGCTTTATYSIRKPITILTFSHSDIRCYGAANGSFSLRVDGGKPPYSYRMRSATSSEGTWQQFNGNEVIINNLSAGTYQLDVRDADGQIAQKAGENDIRRFTITQPVSAIQLSESLNHTTGSNRTDGSILLDIRGGTPSASGYLVRLENAMGNTISQAKSTFSGGIHHLEFSGLSAGSYRLRVADANYIQAQDVGCFIEKNIQITAPENLVAKLTITKAISCHHQTSHNTSDHNNNAVPDSSEDGQLQAQPQGGTPPYSYAWYRIEGNTSQPLAQHNAILSGLSEGTYSVVITDKNKHTATNQITLSLPPVLQGQIGADSSGCEGSAQGKAWINVQGGTPPYQYLWSNGATTSQINNLASGTYLVTVTDANGCQLSNTAIVGTASAITITQETITPPSCIGAFDGGISLSLQGGSGTYLVHWSDGVTSLNRTQIKAGTYTITVTDGTPCGFLQKGFVVTEPEAIALNLPSQITLCQGDQQAFDISIDDNQAQYQWLRNGLPFATQSKVLITQEGSYLAKVITANGCEASRQMQVQLSNQKLDVNFLVTSYAFYDYAVRLVNVGDPLETWHWEIPSEAELISQSAHHIDVKFPKEGNYKVGLRGTLGNCHKELYKTILVEKDSFGEGLEEHKESNLRRFVVSPNPNDGNFRVLILLHNPEAIRLRIYDLQGRQVAPSQEKASAIEFEIPYTYNLSAGQYLVVLEAGKEVRIEKMIVK